MNILFDVAFFFLFFKEIKSLFPVVIPPSFLSVFHRFKSFPLTCKIHIVINNNKVSRFSSGVQLLFLHLSTHSTVPRAGNFFNSQELVLTGGERCSFFPVAVMKWLKNNHLSKEQVRTILKCKCISLNV